MLPLPCCLLSIRETVAAVSSNAERATAGVAGSTGFEWINPTKPDSFTSLPATLLPPHTSVQSN
jgi:hypothetical protein